MLNVLRFPDPLEPLEMRCMKNSYMKCTFTIWLFTCVCMVYTLLNAPHLKTYEIFLLLRNCQLSFRLSMEHLYCIDIETYYTTIKGILLFGLTWMKINILDSSYDLNLFRLKSPRIGAICFFEMVAFAKRTRHFNERLVEWVWSILLPSQCYFLHHF